MQLVASKLLHDDGEEDEVFNEEWANSAGMEKKDLNRLEIEFLSNIDWNCYVSPKQFEKMTDRLEKSVIQRQINGRKDGWTTYTDINVLSKQIHLQIIWERLANVAFQVTAVCLAAYAASLVTMIGTCYALTKANLGPSAVSQSFNTLMEIFQPSENNEKHAKEERTPEEVIHQPDDIFFSQTPTNVTFIEHDEPRTQNVYLSPENENQGEILTDKMLTNQ